MVKHSDREILNHIANIDVKSDIGKVVKTFSSYFLLFRTVIGKTRIPNASFQIEFTFNHWISFLVEDDPILIFDLPHC